MQSPVNLFWSGSRIPDVLNVVIGLVLDWHCLPCECVDRVSVNLPRNAQVSDESAIQQSCCETGAQ